MDKDKEKEIELYGTFKLSESEYDQAKKFREKHRKCWKENPATIGGHIKYSFVNTGLGHIATIKCNICGESEDLTDYDLW